MIFSHISDTHLGMTQYGMEEREQDIYDAFDQAIDMSVQDHVDFVIFSGDIFHMPNPGGTAVVRMANALRKLKKNNIDSFFILGEHDISRIRATPIPYVYHNLGFSTHVGGGKPVEYGSVLICGFDKLRKGEIAQSEEAFGRVASAAKNHRGHNILVMHQGITEFNRFAGEMPSTCLPDGFTYYAMGHLHDHDIKEFSHLSGPVAYPGSTEIIQGEGVRDAKKGFIEVDISTAEAKTSQIYLDTRPQVSREVPYDRLSSAVDDILAELGRDRSQAKKPIIELKIGGEKIEAERIQAQVSRLDELALRCIWKVVHGGAESSVLPERPSGIEEELYRLSQDAVGSGRIADFAVRGLLPLLSSGQTDEAAQAMWEDFERFRKEER